MRSTALIFNSRWSVLRLESAELSQRRQCHVVGINRSRDDSRIHLRRWDSGSPSWWTVSLSSLEPWSLYTDHKPVEMELKTKWRWTRTEGPDGQNTKRADYTKLRGNTKEAKILAETLAKRIGNDLRAEEGQKGEELGWNEIAKVGKKAALEVLG